MYLINMRQIDKIIIHCTATRADRPYSARKLAEDHKARGFDGCGYHYFITRGGNIHSMRPVMRIGAHCAGHNKTSIGIAYEGGLDPEGNPKDTRTPEQKAALIRLIKELVIKHNVKIVVGHRELSPDLNANGIVEPHEWTKLCPCFDASKEYSYLTK